MMLAASYGFHKSGNFYDEDIKISLNINEMNYVTDFTVHLDKDASGTYVTNTSNLNLSDSQYVDYLKDKNFSTSEKIW